MGRELVTTADDTSALGQLPPCCRNSSTLRTGQMNFRKARTEVECRSIVGGKLGGIFEKFSFKFA